MDQVQFNALHNFLVESTMNLREVTLYNATQYERKYNADAYIILLKERDQTVYSIISSDFRKTCPYAPVVETYEEEVCVYGLFDAFVRVARNLVSPDIIFEMIPLIK